MKKNFYQPKQHDLNLKVSELSKRLSDLESRSRKQSSPLSDYRTTSSKSTSKTIFSTKHPKVKTTSSPIFYGKAGTRIKLKKDMTSGAKGKGTDSSKSVKPHTPKSQRGLYKQVYVPVVPNLILKSPVQKNLNFAGKYFVKPRIVYCRNDLIRFSQKKTHGSYFGTNVSVRQDLVDNRFISFYEFTALNKLGPKFRWVPKSV